MHGSNLTKEQGSFFSVWAPFAQSVDVKITSPYPQTLRMVPKQGGYYHLHIPNFVEEVDYFYVLDETKELPDPASLNQPEGVTGPSRTLDHAHFSWTDQAWKGISLKDYILYELHIGTFTEKGTFEAAIDKLPYLKELGITAIELMPVSSFSGARNWGYDGVFPFAPQHTYGGPKGLKALINACHQKGIAVVLDVVYNHFGPEGNVFEHFGPYTTNRYHTPWGKALNFDGANGAAVRQFVIDNAIYWLTEYHIDALRLDAIQSIHDSSTPHILRELQEAFHVKANQLGRQAWVMAESDLNDSRVIQPVQLNGYGIDAQWNDDFHHALRTTIYPEDKNGYFIDFGKMADLKKAITDGFVYDGKWSPYRKKHFGTPSKHLPGDQFIIFTQNHDQIANATMGKRLSSLLSIDKIKVATCILLFSPNIPLFFMGQEWGSQTPFYFFTDFSNPELAHAVKEGRKKEYQAHHIDSEFQDPQALSTFLESKLELPQQNEILSLYKELICLRKEHPALQNYDKKGIEVKVDEQQHHISISRTSSDGSISLSLLANMGQSTWSLNKNQQIILSTDTEILKPWSVCITQQKNTGKR